MDNKFQLTMAEFKGKVLESLDNIEKKMDKNSLQHNEFYTRIRKLEMKPSFSVSPIGWLLSLIGLRK